MRSHGLTWLVAAIAVFSATNVGFAARRWSDSTGQYTVEGDLMAVNETTVVLQKADKKKNLVSMPIARLSKADQEYLRSKEAADAAAQAANGKQTWTMASGFKVAARVIEYGRRDVTIQRRRGKFYVNDRMISNLTEVQQKILLRIVSHFEKTPIDDVKALENWMLKLKGVARTYTCDGVVLELENGDEYGVPFFLFSEGDLKILQPGWEQWLAAHEAKEKAEQAAADKQREALLLQAQAEAYQREREEERKLQMLELELLAVDAGVTDIWEVEMLPKGRGYSRMVVVPGRNSEVAARAALSKFPNYSIGSIARVNRR